MTSIHSSKAPLIALKTKPTVAEMISAAVLLTSIKQANKKPVVLSNNSDSVAKIKSLIGFEIEAIEAMPAKKFVLSIDKNNSEVENVQWQQDEEAVKLFVTLTKGKLSLANMKLDYVGSDYDAIIMPAVTELNQLGKIYQDNAANFKDIKLVAVGSDLNLGDGYQHSSINHPKMTTLAEQTNKAISEQYTTEIAQLLLSGLMAETKNLTTTVESSEIFLTMKKLVDKGAKLEKVQSVLAKIDSSKPKSSD